MAKNIELFDHNEKAYQNLVECLKTHDMCAINHSTGTGKSFIALKYLYENRDKRILYLAPTYPILDQLTSAHMEDLGMDISEFKQFDTMIFRTLLGLDVEDLVDQYDIIVYDEYHRGGAKEWGKQIKKIKQCVRSKNKDIKIIGLTATNKRYLDNERDMTDELFDGVVASTLSLSDAILMGILPPPVYINLMPDVDEDITKLKERLSRNLVFDSMIKEVLKPISYIEDLCDLALSNNPDVANYISSCKKNLVFSSTIEKIKSDKKKINLLFKGNNFDSVEVHSGISREKNLQTLRDFREIKDDDYHFLYSINILNEGLHVKDVDSIVMLRETTSPIIYFQQLGRLLSYSKRKDKVVVFDLVNNLSRNHYIYDLMVETVNRAKKGLIEDPENADRYNNIIENFKVIDISGLIFSELEKIKEKYTREYIIKANLDKAIEILEDPDSYTEEEYRQAKIVIIKSERYINLEMFKRIEQLDVVKPTIFDHSYEEFAEYLNGSENISKIFNDANLTLKQRIKNFVEKYGKIPHLDSDNVDEVNLAKEMLYHANSSGISEYLSSLDAKTLTNFEKASYGLGIIGFDLDSLKQEVIERMDEGFYVNQFIFKLFDKAGDKRFCYEIMYCMEDYKEDFTDTKFFDSYKSRDRLLAEDSNITEIMFLDTYFSDRQTSLEAFDKAENKFAFLKQKADKIIAFINKNYRLPKARRSYVGNSTAEYWLAIDYYVLRDKFESYGLLNAIDDAALQTRGFFTAHLMDILTNKIVDYLYNNKGLLPCQYSTDKDELGLYNAIVFNYNELNDKQLKKIEDAKKNTHLSYMKLYSKYLKYIKEHGYDPVPEDTENNDILYFYERSRFVITDEEKDTIKRIKTDFVYGLLVDFIKDHEGFLPSIEFDDKEFVLMYQKYKNNFTSEQEEYIDLLLNSYISSFSQRFNKLLNFLEKKKRYPLGDSKDKEELKIFDFYIRQKSSFSRGELDSVKKSLSEVSTKTKYKNTYEQMLLNKGRR